MMHSRNSNFSKLSIRLFLRRHNILLNIAELRMKKMISLEKNHLLKLKERSTMIGIGSSLHRSKNSLEKMIILTSSLLSSKTQPKVHRSLENPNHLSSSLSQRFMSLLLQKDMLNHPCNSQLRNLFNSQFINSQFKWFKLNSNMFQLKHQFRWFQLNNITNNHHKLLLNNNMLNNLVQSKDLQCVSHNLSLTKDLSSRVMSDLIQHTFLTITPKFQEERRNNTLSELELNR